MKQKNDYNDAKRNMRQHRLLSKIKTIIYDMNKKFPEEIKILKKNSANLEQNISMSQIKQYISKCVLHVICIVRLVYVFMDICMYVFIYFERTIKRNGENSAVLWFTH